MPRVPFRLTALATATVTATAVLLISGAGSLTAAATSTTPQRAPRPGQWTQSTLGNLENFTDIGLVRGPGGVLHVIWTDGSIGKMMVFDTPIQANGTVNKSVPITQHLNQATFPDATTNGRSLHAFWNQVSNAGPEFGGTAIATWPSGGKHWDPITGVTPAENNNWDFGVAAATGADGQPWVAFIDGGGFGGFEVLHVGHAKRQITMSAGCCRYNAGIGVDSRTSAAWLTWYSNVTNHYGIYAQQLAQNGSKISTPIRMPGSNVGNNALEANQRTTATGLGHHLSGVYLTYLVGWPTATKVDLIRLGAKKPLTVTTQSGMTGSTLAADPFGRLWVAWLRGNLDNNALFVRRAGSGASKFGPQVRVPLPRGTSSLWKVYINAQAKRLDVLALLTVRGKTAYWATQVLPPR
jgi:hypothetical protein